MMSAWQSFIDIIDHQRGVLSKERKRLQEKSPDFVAEWPKEEIGILESDLKYIRAKVIDEQNPSYQDTCQLPSFFKRVFTLAENVKATRDQGKINTFWAALGAYLSESFDRYMKQKTREGSVTCTDYNRDMLFRHFVIQPLLKHLFNKIKNGMEGYVGGASFLLSGIDLAIVQRGLVNELEKENTLKRMLLYPGLLIPEGAEAGGLNFKAYTNIKKLSREYSMEIFSSDGLFEQIFGGEKKGEKVNALVSLIKNSHDRNKTLELLSYNQAVLKNLPSRIRDKFESLGLHEADLRNFRELSKLLQKQDWLIHVIYRYIVDISNVKELRGQEGKLYHEKKLIDFSGKRPVFSTLLFPLVWQLDMVSSDDVKNSIRKNLQEKLQTEKIPEVQINDIYNQIHSVWIRPERQADISFEDIPQREKPKSALMEVASPYGIKYVDNLAGGDAEGVYFEGEWIALKWLFSLKGFYDKLYHKGDTAKEFGCNFFYRSAAAWGTTKDLREDTEFMGTLSFLGNSGKESGGYIYYKDAKGIERRIKNEIIMFAARDNADKSTLYNLFEKIKEEHADLKKILDNKNKDPKFWNELPLPLRNAVEEQLKKNPRLHIDLMEYKIPHAEKDSPYKRVLEDLEGTVYYKSELTDMDIFPLGKYIDKTGKRSWNFNIYAVLCEPFQLLKKFFELYQKANYGDNSNGDSSNAP
ncbi:MAG: hypothetical protein ACPLXC_02750 [Candidatus Pacearchaeota archaeon]